MRSAFKQHICHKRLALIGMLFVFAFVMNGASASKTEDVLEIPFLKSRGTLLNSTEEKVPLELRKFLQKGWTIRSYQYGDLSGRKTRDVAIVLAKNAHVDDVSDAADERKLIVAMRGADGKLHKEVDASNLVFNGAQPQYGSPDVSIEQGCVILHQNGGTRLRTSELIRLKRSKGYWCVASVTSRAFDYLTLGSDDYTSTTMRDFCTGIVQATLEKKHKVIQRQEYIQVYAPERQRLPSGEWKAPDVVLNQRTNLEQGAESWRGPTDLSATIKAMHNGTELTLLVSVRDDDVQPNDRVELLERTKKSEPADLDVSKVTWFDQVLMPTERTRTMIPGGYQEKLVYDLREPPFEERNPCENGPTEKAMYFPLKVTIYDTDKGSQAIKVLSPSRSARGSAAMGGIMLLWGVRALPPKVSEVDLGQPGNLHDDVIDIPSWFEF